MLFDDFFFLVNQVASTETDSDILAELAEQLFDRPALLSLLAVSPHLPDSLLEAFSKHPEPAVRLMLTCNTAVSSGLKPAILQVLLADTNPDIRYSLAENYNLPRETLAMLLDDENPYVCNRARKTLQRLEVQFVHSVSSVDFGGKNDKRSEGVA